MTKQPMRQAPLAQGVLGARTAPSGRTMICDPHTAGRPTTKTPPGLTRACPVAGQLRLMSSAMPCAAFLLRPASRCRSIRPARSPPGTAASQIASAAGTVSQQGAAPADTPTRPSSQSRRSRRTSSTRTTRSRRSRIRFPGSPAAPQPAAPQPTGTSARPARLAAGPGTASRSARLSSASRFRPRPAAAGRGRRAISRGGPARSASRSGLQSEQLA